jgi:hypothetical protein
VCVCVCEERCVESVMWLFMSSLCFRLHSFASKFVALLFFLLICPFLFFLGGFWIIWDLSFFNK